MIRRWIYLLQVFVVFYSVGRTRANSVLTVNSHDLTVLVDVKETFVIHTSPALNENINVTLHKQFDGHLDLVPNSFMSRAGLSSNQVIVVTGRAAGHLEITASSNSTDKTITDDVFVRVVVAKSQGLIYASVVFGWIYFVAWSVSFYPQIWTNYKRKSVEGLNFDFVALNIVGFTLYSLFNCGLFFIKSLQNEYGARYPRGVIPVLLNDVVFSLHAMFATFITIVQCFLYERAQQRISKVAYGLLTLCALLVIISAGLAGGSVIHWLDFLYYCSYIKLGITIIKYIPQALMNYKRKSTEGWSIGNILLDFTGGTLSMLQMLLNAHNYDDWASIFGDPTKFGLGLFSVLFDVFFILQHYVFYRHVRKSESNVSVLNADTHTHIDVGHAKTPKSR